MARTLKQRLVETKLSQPGRAAAGFVDVTFQALILAGFVGFVGELDEAVAMVILAVKNSSQIVGRDPNAAAMTPDRLWIGWD